MMSVCVHTHTHTFTHSKVYTVEIKVISIGQHTGKTKRRRVRRRRRRKWFFNWTYIVGRRTLAWHRRMRKRISHKVIIIIIIRVMIGSSCGNNCHGLLLLDNFVRIKKDVGSHNTRGYSTNQLLWLNLCRYGMCTVRFGICVHSCEQVNEMDGEERNLSSLSLPLSFFSPFSLSLSVSLLLSSERGRERVWNSLSFAHIHTRSACCSLAYIYLLSTVHRPMKFQNRRVKRAEKTTATTREEEREREKNERCGEYRERKTDP